LITIEQCFGLKKGEPTNEDLEKLRAVAPKIGDVSSEYLDQSKLLTIKIDEILSKRAKDAGDATNTQEVTVPGESVVPPSVDSTPSAAEKKLPESQPTKPTPDISDDFMAEINKMLDDVPSKPTSAAPLTTLTKPEMLTDAEFMAEINKMLDDVPSKPTSAVPLPTSAQAK
jgi:hypothetical protein